MFRAWKEIIQKIIKAKVSIAASLAASGRATFSLVVADLYFVVEDLELVEFENMDAVVAAEKIAFVVVAVDDVELVVAVDDIELVVVVAVEEYLDGMMFGSVD